MKTPALSPGSLIPESELLAVLKSCGRKVKAFRNCRIFPPELVEIGDFSQIDEGARIFAGEGVQIGRYVHLAVDSSISGGGKCILQDFVGIGVAVRLITGTEISDGSCLTNPTVPSEYRKISRSLITIKKHALIFTHTTVLPDVTIGEGTVVAAGSIVHHDLKPWSIYAGNPLVQVGVRDSEKILKMEERL
jgi:galactoside O-acetyltransferase